MSTFTDATHNVLFTLDAKRWEHDLAQSSAATLVGYQEAEGDDARATLAAHCKQHRRGLFHPPSSGNAISWDGTRFAPIKGESGVREVHVGARAMGVDAKFNPGRDFTWIGLRHCDGFDVLRINVHPVAGYSRREPDKDSDELSKWKNWAAGQYWLDVLAFTAQQMSRAADDDPAQQRWRMILLGGDYNADLNRVGAWYYPGRMLSALFLNDSHPAGLDHLQATLDSDVRQSRRWVVSKSVNSDHALHFAEWRTR